MSLVDADVTEYTERPGGTIAARCGAAAVAATAAMDAASTVLGLALAPVLVETNPLARALFAAYGVLVTVAVVSVLLASVVLLVTELAVWTIRERARASPRAETAVRLVGYGIPSVVSLYAATTNVALLLRHAPLGA